MTQIDRSSYIPTIAVDQAPSDEHTHFPMLSRHLDVTSLIVAAEEVDGLLPELYADPASRIIGAKMGKFMVENNGGIMRAMRELNAFADSPQMDKKVAFPVENVSIIKVYGKTIIGLTTSAEVTAALNEERAMAHDLTGSRGRQSIFDIIPVAIIEEHEKALHVARSLTELLETDPSTTDLTLGRPISQILVWDEKQLDNK